jgi:hypothetical protein
MPYRVRPIARPIQVDVGTARPTEPTRFKLALYAGGAVPIGEPSSTSGVGLMRKPG